MSRAVYAMSPDFLAQLLEDRRELLAVARSFGSAAEMRSARAELMASLSAIHVTPRNDKQVAESYTVDADGVAHIPIVGELTPHAETDACGPDHARLA